MPTGPWVVVQKPRRPRRPRDGGEGVPNDGSLRERGQAGSSGSRFKILEEDAGEQADKEEP